MRLVDMLFIRAKAEQPNPLTIEPSTSADIILTSSLTCILTAKLIYKTRIQCKLTERSQVLESILGVHPPSPQRNNLVVQSESRMGHNLLGVIFILKPRL